MQMKRANYLERVHVLFLFAARLLGRDFVFNLPADLFQGALLGFGQRQASGNGEAFGEQRPLFLFRQLDRARRALLHKDTRLLPCLLNRLHERVITG